LVKTLSNDSDDEDETKFTNKAEGDEDEEMDYTTSQLYDDVDIRLNEDAAITNKTKVPVTNSSHSSDLAAKFLNFLDIPHTDAEIVSPMDVYVHHEVPSKQTPTLFTIPISVITESSPIYSTIIPQSLPSFTPPPQRSISTPTTTIEATNPHYTLPDFAPVFQFNNRVTTLEKEVAELKKDDPLKNQVIALVDEHLDARLGATRDEFMNFLSASLTERITKQLLDHAILAKESSQPQSSYEAAATLTEFELKKILIDKIDKMYSLKRSQKDKDKHEEPSTGSDRGLKKRKTSKDAETAKEEPEFEVADSDMPQDQEENPEPTDPDWNDRKTPQQGPTQSWLMTLASSADKPSKTFDELMRTPIDFSAYIMNGLKITNLTQKTLLGPAFRLLKGTHSNYAELEYDFEKCYKALLEKLDWENPEGGDYPFDLTKPLPLAMSRNRQKVLVDYFFNNDLKYLQGGISSMTYTTSLTETKAVQYDLSGIKDMVPNIWSPVKVAYDKHALWSISHWRDQLTQVEVMRKHGYGYLKEIVVRRADNDLCTFKEGDFPRLCINDIEDM
ncbi:hypothetical protein Tco_1452415, partial [Tanacetum coccineum]